MNIFTSVFLLFFLLITEAMACDGSAAFDPAQSVSFGHVIVQRDTAVGTVIAKGNATLNGEAHYWIGNDPCNIYFIMQYNGAVSSGMANIYTTNIPGVGIRASMYSWNHGGGFSAPPPGGLITTLSGAGGYGFNAPTVELIKTGAIVSGSLVPGNVAKLQSENNVSTSPNASSTWTLTSPVSVTQVACDIISGPSLSFPIGNVEAGQFHSPGTVSKETNTVKLGLDCDPNANINITLNGAQNAGTSDDSVLALSNQGQNGVAEGIGVQLLYDNNPLKINAMLHLKQSTGGQESFPLTARYIQTKDIVKPGTANATATLNLTYQ